MKKSFRLLTGLLLLGAALPMAALAQVVPGAGNSEAGRVERQIPHQIDRKGRAGNVDIAGHPVETAPPGSDKILFTLNQLVLDGMTAYTPSDLQPLYQSYLGKRISLADLYSIANALQNKYREDGYILAYVVVPRQSPKSGAAHLSIHEGFINKVIVNGVQDRHTLSLMQGYMRQVAGNKIPLNAHTLERAMFLINDIPGLEAKARLTPSGTVPDADDLTIEAARRPFDAAVSLDDYGTRYLGPYQVTEEGASNSLLGLDERIDLQAVVAPDFHDGPELYYLGIDYLQPVFNYGTTINLFANDDYVQPGYLLRQYDANGRALHTGMTVTEPFIRSHDMNLRAHITFDIRNVANWYNDFITQHDRIRTGRVGVQGDYTDRWLTMPATNSAAFELTQGFDILNATGKNDPDVSNPAAGPVFTKLAGEVQRLQGLSDTVDLLTALSGQWANHPLYNAEEFGVGGNAYGRGYDPADVLGDKGVAGKLELQWNRHAGLRALDHYQLYTFLDAGRVWNFSSDLNEPGRGTLVSTGAGVRTTLWQATDAEFYVAQPLNRDVPAEGNRAPRVFFSLVHHF